MQYSAQGTDTAGMRVLLKYWGALTLQNGLLYHKANLKGHDQELLQFVLPGSLKSKALCGLHDDMGHPGMERTLNLLQDWFFWPKMNDDVQAYICQCDRCTKFKQPPERVKLQPIQAYYPSKLVHWIC